MNPLSKWSPFRTTRWDPIQLQLADFERGTERFFGRAPGLAGNGDEPIADITEDEKESVVKVELPEIK